MKGVILHGGHGTRLRPLTHTGPKQLIPVANKPISQYVLEDLRDSGITDIAIILGDIYPEKVREYYGDGRKFRVKITYIYQDRPRGIAHAVSLCRDFVGNEPFVVYLGDNLLKSGIKRYVEKFRSSDMDAMILLCKVKEPQRFGVAQFDKSGRLVKLVEKPKVPPSNYALTGIYFFKPVVFEMIKQLKPSWRGELEITDAIQLLLENGYYVGYDFVSGWWKDTGTFQDILDANRLVLDEKAKAKIEGIVEDGAVVEGRVIIEKNAVVKRNSVIRGPASIGEGTIIGPNAYVGPYTSIGKNCKIENSEVENSVILDGVEIINIKERITESLIGSYCRIIGGTTRPAGHRFVLGERASITL